MLRNCNHDREWSASGSLCKEHFTDHPLKEKIGVSLPIQQRNKNPQSMKHTCYIAWRPPSTSSDAPWRKMQSWPKGPSAERVLPLTITTKSLSSLVSQMLSAGKEQTSEEEAPRCHSKTTVLWDRPCRRLSTNAAVLLCTCNSVWAQAELRDGELHRRTTYVTTTFQTQLILFIQEHCKWSLPGIYKARKLKLQLGQKY